MAIKRPDRNRASPTWQSGTRRLGDPSLPPAVEESLSIDNARRNLASDKPPMVASGAWEMRQLVEKGLDASPLMHTLGSKLRQAMRDSSFNSAKSHLAESIMLSAKSGRDISLALTAVSDAVEDNDLQVRGSALLALGYRAGNGHDISILCEKISARLKDIAPANREAAVWALKVHASKGVEEAHSVLMVLGPEKEDDYSAQT
jgi:hypothetical protein